MRNPLRHIATLGSSHIERPTGACIPVLSTSHLIALLSLVFFLGPLLASAQTDRRISRDPLDYVLPYDIRIQDAGRLGESLLAVWGTRMESEGGTVINALEMNLEGSQRKLTGEDARPYGAVHVISLRNRFVVVWNDRRDGADGIYAAIVDSQGRTERIDLLSPGGIMEGDVYWMEFASGTRFFWSDTRSDSVETYSVTFAEEGDLLEGLTFVRGVGIDEYGTYPTSGGWLYMRHTDGDFTIIRRSGFIDRREIPGDKLSLPYYLLNDTAMVGLGGGEMRFYSSLYQEEPDSAFALIHGASKRTRLSRDSNGFFWFSHFTQKQPLRIFETRRYLPLADSADTDTTMSIVDGYYIPPTTGYWGGPEIDRKSVRERGQNRIYVEIDAHAWHNPFNQVQDVIISHEVRYWVEGLESFEATTGFAVKPEIERLENVGRSAVRIVHHGYELVRFESEVPPTIYRPSFRRPSIVLNESVQCSWFAEGDSLYYTTTDETLASQEQHVVSLPGVPFQMWMFAGSHAPVIDIEHKEENSGMDNFHVRSRDILWWLSDSGWSQHEFSGWQGYTFFDRYIRDPISAAVAADPNLNMLVAVTELRERSGASSTYHRMTIVDGKERAGMWLGIDRPEGIVDYVPVDTLRGLLFLTPDQCLVVEGDTNFDTLSLPPLPEYDTVQFRRLYGNRFLRAATLSNGEGLLLELFTTDCRSITSRRLTHHPYENGFFILQNPSDGGLILLSGSARGVRASYLGKRLGDVVDESGRRMIDVRVSETSDTVGHPAGIVRNDTLFVVWEDFRLGSGSDIFGTSWTFPSGLHELHEIDSTLTPPIEPIPPLTELLKGIEIRSVRPNPAYGQADLIVESAIDQSAEVTVYDGLGRMVSKRRVVLYEGLNRVAVGLTGLPSGSYQARVEPDNGRARTARLILYQR